ncbi:MAG: type II toxin-antitoxin system HicB family antitoxin [Thermodesulfobacteriota bacterium]
MNVIKYKDYLGAFSYDPEADIFHGEVVNIADVVTFQGRSLDQLKRALKDSVEDYLVFCQEMGKDPERPFSGRFNLRLPPELHRQAAQQARLQGKSLNAWVAEALERAVKDAGPA